MRMLVKYTAFIDLDQDGNETDRSHYLSLIRKDDVMDLPFDSIEELKQKAGKYTLADYVKSEEFKEKILAYDDYEEFFRDVDTMVLYQDSIAVDLSALTQ